MERAAMSFEEKRNAVFQAASEQMGEGTTKKICFDSKDVKEFLEELEASEAEAEKIEIRIS